MKKSKVNKISFEVILLAIVELIINILSLKVPSLFFELMFIAPIPIVILTVKYKETIASIVSIMVFLLLLLFFTIPQALVNLFLFGIVGIAIGYCLRNRLSLKLSIIVGGVSYIVAFILIHLIFISFYKINIIQDLFISKTLIFLENNKSSIGEIFKLNGASKDAAYLQIREYFDMVFLLIPCFITAISLVGGYIVLIISLAIIKQMKIGTFDIEPFSQFKLPLGFGIAYIIAQFALWGKDLKYGYNDKWTMIFSNMFWLLTFSFMVQGIALIDFWLKKIGLTGILRVMAYAAGSVVIIPFILFFPTILVIIGILDYVIDFRKLEAK